MRDRLDRLRTRQSGPPTTPAMAIPGLGNFLIKVGGRTGIPIPVALTPVEWALNDTNEAERTRSRPSSSGRRILIGLGCLLACANVEQYRHYSTLHWLSGNKDQPLPTYAVSRSPT